MKIIETNVSVAGGLEEKQAGLVASLAVLLTKAEIGKEERDFAIGKILSGDLKSNDQVSGELQRAFLFLSLTGHFR